MLPEAVHDWSKRNHQCRTRERPTSIARCELHFVALQKENNGHAFQLRPGVRMTFTEKRSGNRGQTAHRYRSKVRNPLNDGSRQEVIGAESGSLILRATERRKIPLPVPEPLLGNTKDISQ